MKIEKFEDIMAWQKGRELSLLIYSLLKNSHDFRFRDQMQSAAVSIMNNIAEGFERKGNKEFSRFLYIAKGSCAEVRSMCYLAKDLGVFSEKQFADIHARTAEISRLIGGFIKVL